MQELQEMFQSINQSRSWRRAICHTEHTEFITRLRLDSRID